MSTTKEKTEHPPAPVLVDIPDIHLNLLNDILKLVNPVLQPLVADVLRIIPKDILLDIIGNKPESKIRVIECVRKAVDENITRSRYASWMKHQLIPEGLKEINWEKIMEIMGPVRDQGDHDVCCAIVATELIWALRHIEGRDNEIYSPQELIDFVDPKERKLMQKEGHFCKPSKLTKCFEYVIEKTIQTEDHRKFKGCYEEIPELTPSPKVGYIGDFKRLPTTKDALLQLIKQPIGASVAMFLPDYREIGKDEIYRGPVTQNSYLRGMHAISLMAVGEENGESYILARASHGQQFGKNGYLKISLDVVLVYIPVPGEREDLMAKKYYSKPGSLLGRFSYPILLTKEEEEKREKTRKEEMINLDKMEID